MSIKSRMLLCLGVLAMVDMIIPIPITALMLIYVIFKKPAWFSTRVEEIYGKRAD